MQIGGVTLRAEDVSWVEREGARPGVTRSHLARGLCERLDLRDGRGRPREVAARIDLSRHARAGRVVLPEVTPAFRRIRKRPAPPSSPVLPQAVPSLEILTVHRVLGRSDPMRARWQRAFQDHHYLGAGPLCGAQLHYVVLAQDHVVAALAFSAGALKARAREEFIGWSAAARRRNRPLVIGQTRFCLTVRAPNLASRVQSLVLKRVGEDWEEAYGRRPVLAETFVDLSRFDGACYRASNWIEAGKTQGRGRQDSRHQKKVPVKAVYLYPLQERWREVLQLEPVRPIDPDQDWAEIEWGSVDLQDRRRTRRLVRYGRARFERLHASTPESLGSKAFLKSAYRLLNHPSASLESFLTSHREATLARAAEQPVVLAIQDTTSLNYTTHRDTEGLGPIGSFGAQETRGLEMHSVFLSSVAGTPLGLLDIHVWARDPKAFGQAKKRYDLPTEQKESAKWLRGYQAVQTAAQRLDHKVQFVVIGDREADMYDLFVAAQKGPAHVLVRATYPRRILTSEVTPDGKRPLLWDSVRALPVATTTEVPILRSGSRRARIATLELRYRPVEIERPQDRLARNQSVRAVCVWAIAATETRQSAGGLEPIEWLLLTTLPVESNEAAIEKLAWYRERWQIEVFHRTLKTGCKVERRQSKTADSLEAALAIDAVVAWRVLMLVKLGRESPDLPCSVLFTEDEWKALHCFYHRTRNAPERPPTLRWMLHTIAQLGGFVGRGDPGAETTWKGLERLTDITTAYQVFFSSA